ncbi:MAG: DNA-formamidopyrimidine glycosylase family protein [Opitutaceae bacterium]
MPELAEVEFYRKQWNPGLGHRIQAVRVHPRARVFRECNICLLVNRLTGARLRSSSAAAKQMLFRCNGGCWLGIHLGLSGELRMEPADYAPRKHDHLVLKQREHCFVFTDPRMFGRVRFGVGQTPPAWWTHLAPAILSAAFTTTAVTVFLHRHRSMPIKAVLLMQECFPGVGNWMADEILWRAAVHPRRSAGTLTPAEVRSVWRECRKVCRLALDTIAGRGHQVPPALNVHIPDSWLFNHRWEDGGCCPRTGVPLVREQVGGRTTCWSPARQRL